MSVHFNFIVDDVDAENIMGLFHSEIVKCHVSIMDCVEDNNKDLEDAYRKQIEYIESLRGKMHNERIN